MSGEEALRRQLRMIPVPNPEAKVEVGDEDAVRLTIPLRHRPWSRMLQTIAPIRDHVRVEIDRMSTELLMLCDGETDMETIIDTFAGRWKLSFFEARAMIFTFYRNMEKKRVLFARVPEEDAAADAPESG
jgi:hypothetical protein